MASLSINQSLSLPRWQSNWPICVVPSFVRLHELKPQKTWSLRAVSKKKSGAKKVIDIEWVAKETPVSATIADNSREESLAAVVVKEGSKMTPNNRGNHKTQEGDERLEATIKMLLVEGAARKDMMAAQEQKILELQRRVARLELDAAQERKTAELQRSAALLELSSAQKDIVAAQKQKILQLQRRIAQFELNAESNSKTKSKTKTLTKTHTLSDDETDEQHERTTLVNFSASSDEEEHAGVKNDYTMDLLNVLKRTSLKMNAESKSKKKTPTKTPATATHVLSDDEKHAGDDHQRDRTPLVNVLQGMQSKLNAESKFKKISPRKTPRKTLPTKIHGLSEDEQHEMAPVVNNYASSNEEEHDRFEDDYALTVMNTLQRMQLELNTESKSKKITRRKTPPTEIHRLSDGETGEKRTPIRRR